MYELGIIFLVFGLIVLCIIVFDDSNLDDFSVLFLILAMVLIISGIGMIHNSNSKNPLNIQQNKHEELQKEIQRITSEKTKWKYYNSLKKKNKALEKKLKQLKSEN